MLFKCKMLSLVDFWHTFKVNYWGAYFGWFWKLLNYIPFFFGGGHLICEQLPFSHIALSFTAWSRGHRLAIGLQLRPEAHPGQQPSRSFTTYPNGSELPRDPRHAADQFLALSTQH